MAELKSWNGDYMTCKKPKYLACSPLQENGIINGIIYVKKKERERIKTSKQATGSGASGLRDSSHICIVLKEISNRECSYVQLILLHIDFKMSIKTYKVF